MAIINHTFSVNTRAHYPRGGNIFGLVNFIWRLRVTIYLSGNFFYFGKNNWDLRTNREFRVCLQYCLGTAIPITAGYSRSLIAVTGGNRNIYLEIGTYRYLQRKCKKKIWENLALKSQRHFVYGRRVQATLLIKIGMFSTQSTSPGAAMKYF